MILNTAMELFPHNSLAHYNFFFMKEKPDIRIHIRSQVAKLLDKIFDDWSGHRHWKGLSGTEGTRTQAWLQDACLQVSSNESGTFIQHNRVNDTQAETSGLATLHSF